MKKSQLRQIIKEEIRNLYLAEAGAEKTEKDALNLAKIVEKAYSNKKYYKTKTRVNKNPKSAPYTKAKNKTVVETEIMFNGGHRWGGVVKSKFKFYVGEADGNGEVGFYDPQANIRDRSWREAFRDWLSPAYLGGKTWRKPVTFDVFKKTAPAILKHWSKQAIKDGVVEPL